MTLREAILAGRPRAILRVCDLAKTHADAIAMIQHIYREAGRAVPDLATIDAWIYEAEEGYA